MIRPERLAPADLDLNARTVLAKRYLKKNERGQVIEEPEDMFWRVAHTIASVDAKYGATEEEVERLAVQFYDLMTQRLFMPNSPTLMNAGRPLGQLSACFVLPVSDTLSNRKDGIYDTLRDMAIIHQSGGGTGFSFSRLRPKGSVVRSSTGVASGPISFMQLYDASTNVVKQGGTRRGANMGILRVDHPDIRDFITCKRDTSQITNFNISVAITDAFMKAVEKDDEYELQDGRFENAKEIMDLIIESAHATGEPGVFFIDEANRHNPVPSFGSYEATNPCGEQPLLPYDVCNLGSINMGMFVKDGKIDYNELEYVIRLAVHFLDNVIDANQYPLPEITELAQQIRRIGLGPMGFADMLIQMGVTYGSPESISLTRKLAKFFESTSHQASRILAAKRGTFPAWRASMWGPDWEGKRIRPETPLRNCNVTTVAPTGTISIIAGCSSGIEPLFALAFRRFQADEHMTEVNGTLLQKMKDMGWGDEEIDSIIVYTAEYGHLPDDVKAQFPEFVTAHEITPSEHVDMQATWQKRIDSAISKTINFAASATKEDVAETYKEAWKKKCKGITVYRDGSRGFQPLSTGATAAPETSEEDRCPECDNLLRYEEGCTKCTCGFSACSVGA